MHYVKVDKNKGEEYFLIEWADSYLGDISEMELMVVND